MISERQQQAVFDAGPLKIAKSHNYIEKYCQTS